MTLVAVQTTAILLFKLCQQNGTYTFSVASSVALTELCKLALAASMHIQHVASSKKAFWEGVNVKIIVNYFGLSTLYTINNQLSFYVLEIADPGSMALGKSIAPYLCALLLRFAGQQLRSLQWVCVVIQCCAIAIVQYDACRGAGQLPTRAYYMIATAVSITAVTSVWNQLIIKGFDVPVNLQNSIMYFFGSIIATASYAHTSSQPLKRGAHHKGFFEGYTPLAVLLVLFQAFHGLAVALVYKYADAIVKNFASSSVMAILIVISAYFFSVETNAHSWLGVAIVLTTTYCYMNIALRMPAPASSKPPPTTPSIEQEKEGLLEEGSGGEK